MPGSSPMGEPLRAQRVVEWMCARTAPPGRGSYLDHPVRAFVLALGLTLVLIDGAWGPPIVDMETVPTAVVSQDSSR